MRALFITGALFAFAAAACSVPTAPSESAGGEEVGASEAAVKLSDVSTVPAYFGIDNRFTPNGDDPWIYAKFTAYKNKDVTASVSVDVEGATVGFKLYRVLPNDTLKLVTSVDGPNGEATLSFTSKGTGIYVIEMVTSASISDLTLHLECAGGACSPDPEPGDFCGGLAGVPCPEGLYCKYAPEAICGAADAGGTCEVQPQVCTKEYNPVCGCDGQTYANACIAASAGVSVVNEGECAPEPGGGAAEGELCGGIAGIACGEGLFCAYAPEASCGAGDQSGVCARRPDFCIELYAPVCGCDGMTYGNACKAASSGVSVAHKGKCSAL